MRGGHIWSVFALLTVTEALEGLDFKVVGESIVTEALSGADAGANSDENDATTPSQLGSENWGEGPVAGEPIPALPSTISDTSYPWLASIQRNKKQICTGTLIDKEYVLTTAFCLFQLTPLELGELEIGIGYQAVPIAKSLSYELHGGPFATLKIKKAIRHLRFSPTTGYNDIGLLQLAEPIASNLRVEPIALAQELNLEGDASIHNVVGWRVGVDLNGDGVEYWRNQEIQGVTLEKCRKGYADILDPQGVSPGMICSGGDSDATSCRWKFGTPLIAGLTLNSTEGIQAKAKPEVTQIGLFSWGSEALLPECRYSEDSPSPLVFTRVASYKEWIQQNTKQLISAN